MAEWNVTEPDGSELANTIDDIIRALKSDIQNSLRGQAAEGTEAIFPGDDTASPVYRYRGLKGVTGARPATGYYGLFFDETRNVMQRDNGTSWEDVGTVIPAGTVMVFYQASVPTGWAAVATLNDRALRVVTADGVGGTTGGTDLMSALKNHTHTAAAHQHIVPITAINHSHETPILNDSGNSNNYLVRGTAFGVGAADAVSSIDYMAGNTGAGANRNRKLTNTIYASSYPEGDTRLTEETTPDASGAATNGDLAYINVILGTKS